MAENENIRYLEYGDKEIECLSRKDRRMAEVIEKVGPVKREVYPDLFGALMFCIVGQQISTKAQVSIWAKIESTLGQVTPEIVATLEPEKLQSCGISWRKVKYMQGIARQVLDGEFDIDALNEMSDSEVCARLSQLRGIGVWSAEMLMIFSMQRPNIFSFGDLAILRGLRMVYRHREITRELFEKYRRRFSPYCTVASLYLWAVAGGAIPGLTDPAPKAKSRSK